MRPASVRLRPRGHKPKQDVGVALVGSLVLHATGGDTITVTGGPVTVLSQARYDELLACERARRVA